MVLVSFNGASWEITQKLPNGSDDDISCTHDGFCMLIAGKRGLKGTGFFYETFEHGSWSARTSMPRLAVKRNGQAWFGGYRTLSCYSKDICSAAMSGNQGYCTLNRRGFRAVFIRVSPPVGVS